MRVMVFLADDVSNILELLSILGALLLGLAGVYFLIKKMKRSSQQEFQTDFTLHDLRQLHQAGHMSDAEYAAAKAKVVERSTMATNPPNKPGRETP